MSQHRQRHNRYQREIFDNRVDDFRQRIGEEIHRRTWRIVVAASLLPDDRVLDVGTGTGVLISHIQHYGVRDIVGCDISPAMLSEATDCFPGVHFWCGDVIDLPPVLGSFDVVFFNAMFGNVCDQAQTLRTMTSRLNIAGKIIVSHPMGAGFQAKLREENPRLVPHLLPDRAALEVLIDGLGLKIRHFLDEEKLYLCCLERKGF